MATPLCAALPRRQFAALVRARPLRPAWITWRGSRARRLAGAVVLTSQLAALTVGCLPTAAPPATAAGHAGTGAAVTPTAALALPAAPTAVSGPAAAPVAYAAPLPAPSPSTALDQARLRLLDGDYLKAVDELTAIRRSYPGTAEEAEATFRLGEASLADDQFLAAADYLRLFLAAYPTDPRRAAAQLMLGRAQEGLGDGGAAAAAYQQYAAAGDDAFLGDVLHLRTANLYFNAGRAADGWAELSAAARVADKSPSNAARIRVYDALGARYLEAGNRAQAAAAWQAQLEAMVAARRSAADTAALAWKLVGTYQTMGQRDVANQLRRRIVSEWPKTATALQAMNDLGPDTLPAFLRGQIAFANRRWPVAIDAFTTYLDLGAPEGHDDEARYDRAIALTRTNDPGALDALDAVAAEHPTSQYAPEALWEAGSQLLRQNDKPAALARFEQLAVNYPASTRRGQALYWLGRYLPEIGNAAAGRRYMEAAASAPYEDYYTFRARGALQRPSPAPRPLDDQERITAEDRAGWERWLADHGRAPQAQAERRAQMEADPRFARGIALLEAGLNRDAEQEFRELLEAFENDPVAVEHVAVAVRDRGMFPLSVTLGHRLEDTLAVMGEPSFLNAPRVVQKLVLPLAFLKLVAPAAQTEQVDPLLLLGLMKQESWFEPRAASSAAARGLTQFIFETARTVASDLQWPNWKWDDMNRPYVSVPFGAHYLSGLIRDFRGNYYFALAGYNGGPGNVLRWAKGDWNRDVDTFVEEIGYSETRSYVRAVTGNYELYKAVYYR